MARRTGAGKGSHQVIALCVSHGETTVPSYLKVMPQSRFPSIDLSNGLAGKLLIAMPHLDETPFERSVCLICSHDDEHAFGVVVNKPVENVTVGEVVSELGIEADAQTSELAVHFGGPVDLQRGAVLHSLDFRTDDTIEITANVGLTATKEALETIADSRRAPKSWLLIMGHAGWDGGQLEDEIKRNDWLNLQGDAQLVFQPTEGSWAGAMKLLGVSDLSHFGGGENPIHRPN